MRFTIMSETAPNVTTPIIMPMPAGRNESPTVPSLKWYWPL